MTPSAREHGRGSLGALLADIRGCRVCAGELPHEPRPVLAVDERARVLVIGQAPGRRVHAGGVAWDDASGARLREWLAVDEAAFRDPRRFALVPMGFCYPGSARGGDLPPRPECAPLWHPPLLERLPDLRLTLLVGRHAVARYLPECVTLTEAVRGWRDRPPGCLALPHPSPRNNRWLARNPWFARELLPELRARLAEALA